MSQLNVPKRHIVVYFYLLGYDQKYFILQTYDILILVYSDYVLCCCLIHVYLAVLNVQILMVILI